MYPFATRYASLQIEKALLRGDDSTNKDRSVVTTPVGFRVRNDSEFAFLLAARAAALQREGAGAGAGAGRGWGGGCGRGNHGPRPRPRLIVTRRVGREGCDVHACCGGRHD